MKILYLTAYYPPDFASGATLQVQRLAERAVAAGHDVHVFSGAVRKGLADGELAVEDVGGVAVHWIGSTGWVHPADDANWWNPAATDAMTRLLDELTPDIVHAHTLQTLGGGTVEAALDRGSRTIVTMHDHWWWCALLFLVGNDLRPCTPVTDVGNCVCAKVPAWRTARAASLRKVLDRVDEVLVPSGAMRDLVVANGVDPARVSVDANDVAVPVAVSPRPPERTSADGPVRFIYFGGDHGVKGVDVLLNAATMLRREHRWTLDMYGVAERPHLASSPVMFRPAFEPGAISRILSAADVMVLPSIARESFSIAVRESLGAGLAVITSDCYGPEEVVSDGINGFVVPTGDADALSAAMVRLIDDPALLRRMRTAVAETPVSMRSPDEHASSLLARYSAPRPPGGKRRPTRVGYVVDSHSPGLRFRADHGAEALELHGVSTSVVEAGSDLASLRGAEFVILQDATATSPLLSALSELRASGTALIYDASDAAFAQVDDPLAERRLEALSACDRVIGATAAVAARATRLTGLAITVVPNAVGIAEIRLADEVLRQRLRPLLTRGPQLVAVVRSQESWHEAEPLVAALLDAHRRWRLLILGDIGGRRGLDRLGRRIRHETLHDWRSLPSRLASADAVLAPFGAPGSPGAEAASTIAWLEASLVEVPVVAMAAPGTEQPIDHGRTGLVAGDDADWASVVESLAGDSEQRRRIGRAARRQVLLHHGPHSTAHHLLDTLATTP